MPKKKGIVFASKKEPDAQKLSGQQGKAFKKICRDCKRLARRMEAEIPMMNYLGALVFVKKEMDAFWRKESKAGLAELKDKMKDKMRKERATARDLIVDDMKEPHEQQTKKEEE